MSSATVGSKLHGLSCLDVHYFDNLIVRRGAIALQGQSNSYSGVPSAPKHIERREHIADVFNGMFQLVKNVGEFGILGDRYSDRFHKKSRAPLKCRGSEVAKPISP